MSTTRDMCLYGSVVNIHEAAAKQHAEMLLDSEEVDPVSPIVPAPLEQLKQRRRSRSKPSIICEECEAIVAVIHCIDCNLHYCAECDVLRHRKGNLKFHQRHELDIKADVVKPVEQWKLIDVLYWLEHVVRLGQYQSIFQTYQMSGQDLLDIQNEEFLENKLGIAMRVHRRKLLREIQKLRSEQKRERSQSAFDTIGEFEDHYPSDLTSPVAKMRARTIQGQNNTKGHQIRRSSAAARLTVQTNCGDIKQKGDAATNKFQLKIDVGNEKSPNKESTGIPSRRNITGLALDLDKISNEQNNVRSSFNFSAEGTLKTEGFEISTGGISNTPFMRTGKTVHRGTKDYLIMLKELGQGAGGKVYKALHVPTLKLVAVKVVRLYDKEKRHQMVRELKSLYANLVSISEADDKGACNELVVFHDAFTNPDKGTVSIVIEYMDAGSLEDLLQSGKCCSEQVLKSIAQQTLKGLVFLHERHLLHRDIKPSNILLSKSGQAKISDFGISRDLESTMAKATTFTGTLMYMAPERISGGTYSYPSDIWSLGLSLFAFVVGRIPLPVNDGYWGVVHAVQQLPSPNLQEYGEYSPDCVDFLDQCLRKDPRDRPSAQELLQHPFLQGCQPFSLEQSKSPTPMSPVKLNDLRTLVEQIIQWYHNQGISSIPISRKKVNVLSSQLNVDSNTLVQLFQEVLPCFQL